jgi:hypothetical protein
MEFKVNDKVAVFTCQGCGRIMGESEMMPLPEKDILERVSPGEPMPYGECSYCRAVVHPLDLTRHYCQIANEILETLEIECSGRCMDSHEDRAVTAAILTRYLYTKARL